MKHICDSCGHNYKEDGLAVDMSVTAIWNNKKDRYEFRPSFVDTEIKCPNCYAFVDEKVHVVKEQ